jgi:hypothetical protein
MTPSPASDFLSDVNVGAGNRLSRRLVDANIKVKSNPTPHGGVVTDKV